MKFRIMKHTSYLNLLFYEKYSRAILWTAQILGTFCRKTNGPKMYSFEWTIDKLAQL